MKKLVIGASAFGLVAGAAVAAEPHHAQKAVPAISAQFSHAGPTNYDATFRAAARSSFAVPALPVGRNGQKSSFDARLGVPTFLWAPADDRAAATGPLRSERAKVEARARDFLRRQSESLRLTGKNVDDALLTEIHDTGRGAVIARFSQRVAGLDVFGRQLNVMMDRSGRLVATSGYFAPSSAVATASKVFAHSSAEAVAKAFADLGGLGKASDFTVSGRKGAFENFRAGSIRGDLQVSGSPRAKQVWFAQGERLLPAYYVELSAQTRDAHTQRDFGYVISAADASVLFRKNLTEYEQGFTYRMFADTDPVGHPFDEPVGNGYAPFPGDSYDDVITPVPAEAQLVQLNSSALLSTGDPWLAPGARQSVGNNVDAYVDIDTYKGQFVAVGFSGPTDGLNPRLGDFRASITAPRTFDYPLVAYSDPATTESRNAAIVNLFYMNNWEHDFWYDHGFDEAAGNAQMSNYGRGGEDGDPIHAEAQDAGGSNNANMLTPADGGSPRMQMYLFDGPLKGSFEVTAPVELAGEYPWSGAGFGPQEFSFTGELVLVQDGSTGDGTGSTTDACEPLTNAADVAGRVALLDRGTCDFVVKVANAQNAGAIAAVVANNTSGAPITMGGSNDELTIPAVMVTQEDGATFKASEAPVVVDVVREEATKLDGTIDEGIIAHEYFHYVSNRLVANASGLSNTQGRGMGEGWSDFNTLLLEVRDEDRLVAGNEFYQKPYAVAFYVVSDLYFGIRRAPFSTDFNYNALTFKHIENGVPLPTTAPLAFGQDGANNAEVHNSGEIWANTLWEVYANFLNDRRYSYEEARAKMQDYVIAGLKMTPPAPTFLEARDGIIAAAIAGGDLGDYYNIVDGFANRGMGAYAVAPDRDSTDNSGVVEDFTVFGCPEGFSCN